MFVLETQSLIVPIRHEYLVSVTQDIAAGDAIFLMTFLLSEHLLPGPRQTLISIQQAIQISRNTT